MNKANNPLNIKAEPGKTWNGATGVDEHGTVIFADPTDGIRAAARTFCAKWYHGKTTLEQIISEWAPADDTIGSIPGNPPNSPTEYIQFVQGRSSMVPDQEIGNPTMFPAQLFRILKAMARFEMGEECPSNVLFIGIGKWLRDFIEK